MTDTTRQEAYRSGRTARIEGKPESANPHPFVMGSTLLWLAEGWQEGWRDSDAMLRALGQEE